MTIREATTTDAAGIARVHVDSWRTTYADIVPATYLDSLSYADREARWNGILHQPDAGNHIYVATNDTAQIVGFAAGGAQRTDIPDYAGELYAIYLLREAQGGGLGRRLMGAVVASLAGAGVRSMLAWVLAGNPAHRFYEKLGGQIVAERPTEIGGAALSEVAYGWPDTTPLLPAPPLP